MYSFYLLESKLLWNTVYTCFQYILVTCKSWFLVGTTDNTTRLSRRLRSHKEHDMTLINGDQSSYKCSGCKKFGFRDRYKCVLKDCAHILHPDCRFFNENATHEFLNGSIFNFFIEHFGGKNRYWDVCGIGIKGYFYHCNECLNLQKTVQVLVR